MITAEQPSVPFVYGRPVRPEEFLNREAELLTVFNRLRNGEGTAITGEPHIGKSSLLLKLADLGTRRVYLGNDAQRVAVSRIDLHPIGNDYTPTAFWEEVLEPLRKHPRYPTTARLLREATRSGYDRRSLQRLFNHLSRQSHRLLLLLDEFERLLLHPSFQEFAFFATLRSLASWTGGLSYITASRLSVGELNERGYRLPGSGGSPLFNIQSEVKLHPFDEASAGVLLSRGGDALSPNDRQYIRHVAGRHPFLLQAMAAAMVEISDSDRHARAAERFYERVSSHFDDLWRTLDDRTITTAIVLSLVELGGHALGKSFDFSEIETVDAFGPELRRLAERGLAEKVGEGWQFDWQHLLLWRGERWTVGTQAFVWWVRDVVIAGTRPLPAYDEWLKKKCYRFLLTQEQWDWLVGTVRNAPGWAAQGVGWLARMLLEGMVKKV